MSDYTHRPGGSLKFKGEDKKKKKKKSHSSTEVVKKDAEIAVSAAIEKRYAVDAVRSRSGSGAGSASGSPAPRKMTDAERRYEEVQRKRREEKARKSAHQTHTDRVNELNKKLDSLSDHHDMPRIGPG